MRRTLLGKTALALAIFFLAAGFASATHIPFETGTYVLGNHPDGNAAPPHYGLRIDNLFGGVDPFTFDFECVGCDVKLVYDGVRSTGHHVGSHGQEGWESV
jgi:hypothetical protein